MQSKYDVKLSGMAKEDLKKIVTYIKKNLNEPTIAKKYAQIIKEKIKTLEYMPQRNMIIYDETIKDMELRKLIIKNYIAFYRINEQNKVVSIERILYCASNWNSNIL